MLTIIHTMLDRWILCSCSASHAAAPSEKVCKNPAGSGRVAVHSPSHVPLIAQQLATPFGSKLHLGQAGVDRSAPGSVVCRLIGPTSPSPTVEDQKRSIE